MIDRAEKLWLQLSDAEKAMFLRGESVPGLSDSDLTLLRQWASSRISEITTAEPFDLSVWSSGQQRFTSSRTPTGLGSISEEFSPEPLKQYLDATAGDPSRPSSEVNPLDFYNRDSSSGDGDLTDGDSTGGDSTGGDPTGGDPTATTAAISLADMSETKRILAERFGGFGFFLDDDNPDIQVGIAKDANGRFYIVEVTDPNALYVTDLLSAIQDTGITDESQILGAIQKTQWSKNTDAMMRQYDVDTANMNDLELVEYLEPVLDRLNAEALYLGVQLDPDRAMELAGMIKRLGDDNDILAIRNLLSDENVYNFKELEASAFANQRDSLMAMSRQYFVPIDEDSAAKITNQIYLGDLTLEGQEQLFRQQAAARYPMLQNALNSGVTPEMYFSPYKYEVERLLGRKNIDLYEEFPDIIQGIQMQNGDYRAMTTHELRRYVRGLDEWQQSPQGLDSARSLSFAIGKLFGEVA